MAGRTGKLFDKKAESIIKAENPTDSRALRQSIRNPENRPNYKEHSSEDEDDKFYEPSGEMATLTEAVSALQNLNFKLPPFWESEPASWFTRIEFEFVRRKISDGDEKVACVLNALNDEQVRALSSFMKNPPTTEKYETVKKLLVNKYAETLEDAFESLFPFNITPISDSMLPSELMDSMLRSATKEFQVTAEFRQLFLRRLPISIAAVAKDQSGITDLKDLAKKCDQLLAACNMAKKSVNSVAAVNSMPDNSKSHESMEINAIGQRGRGMNRGNNFRGGNHFRGGFRGRGRGYWVNRAAQDRANRPPPASGICWAHWMHGNQAAPDQCKPWCTFVQKNSQGRVSL